MGCGMVRRGMVRWGRVWFGKARMGGVRHGPAWYGLDKGVNIQKFFGDYQSSLLDKN